MRDVVGSPKLEKATGYDAQAAAHEGTRFALLLGCSKRANERTTTRWAGFLLLGGTTQTHAFWFFWGACFDTERMPYPAIAEAHHARAPSMRVLQPP